MYIKMVAIGYLLLTLLMPCSIIVGIENSQKNQNELFFDHNLLIKKALCFHHALFYCHGKSFPNEPKKINIISYRNGVGLNRDIDILAKEFAKLGYWVGHVDYRNFMPRNRVDINVFVEVTHRYFFQFADKNYLIPNAEWFREYWVELIPHFDKILCKTKEAVRIFKPLNPNTEFISFTSMDRYDPLVKKDYKSPLHVCGASIAKGTDTIVRTWKDHPEFPHLLLLRHLNYYSYPAVDNLTHVTQYLKDAELKLLQNCRGLHICPSETEGFGHYIFEAKSCGAVIITTDAPPMNEFITDKRFLAGYKSYKPVFMAKGYHVDTKQLAKSVANVLTMPEEELVKIGMQNRQDYLDNDHFFKQRIAEVFKIDSVDRNKTVLKNLAFCSEMLFEK